MLKTITIITILIFFTMSWAQAQTVRSKPSELNVEDFCAGPSIQLNGETYTIKEDGFCDAIKDLKEENSTPDADLINDINYTFMNLDPTNLVKKNNCNSLSSPEIYPKYNVDLELNESLKSDRTKWQIRLYTSHSFTKYAKSDFKMRSSRINIDVKDLPIDGRDGHEWFSPKKFLSDGHNPAQMLDEPSNTFTIGLSSI
jgi:hypothetical protein